MNGEPTLRPRYKGERAVPPRTKLRYNVFMNDERTKRLQSNNKFLYKMHKDADAQRKRDEERLKHPMHFGKPEDTRVLLVKVGLLEPTPLKLGQRVEVRIEKP